MYTPTLNYKVYAKTNAQNCITTINSDAFLSDTTGWTQIDEGDGDRYHHAQGNYLPGPLIDELGRYRYKLVDGAAVERTPEEIAADILPTPEPSLFERNRADIDFLAMMTGVSL